MKRSWEKLVELNKHNKEIIFNSNKKNYIEYHIVYKNDKYYIFEKEQVITELNTYDDVLYSLTKPNNNTYIRNISILRDSFVMKKYRLKRDWTIIYSIIREMLIPKTITTLEIRKISDIDTFISKNVLLKKRVDIVTETEAYILLRIDKHLLLVSDLDFKLSIGDKVSLSELNVENVYIDNLDLSDVLSIDFFFCNMRETKNIRLKDIDTSNILKFNGLFAGCIKLEYVNTEILDTSKARSLRGMFSNCSSLKGIDLSNFKIKVDCELEFVFFKCNYRNTFNITDKRLLDALESAN